MESTILLIGFGVCVAGAILFAWLQLVRLALTGRWIGRPVPQATPLRKARNKDDVSA